MLPDPFYSADPAARLLAVRYREASRRADALRAYLVVYAEGRSLESGDVLESVSAEAHYGFDELVDCGCAICVEWTVRRAEFVSATSLIPKGHKWTVCGCDACRFVGRFQMNYLAAANRRDLLIEMSFHAWYHSLHGARVMEWYRQEIQNPVYSDNWMAQEFTRYPMERWLMKCNTALSGSVGGPVFQASARRLDYIERSSSSLTADTNLMVIG